MLRMRGWGQSFTLTRPRSRSIACHLRRPAINAKLLLALAFWNIRDMELSDSKPNVQPVPASSFDQVEPLHSGSAAAEEKWARQRGAYMRLSSVPAAAAESSRRGTVPVEAPANNGSWYEPGTCHSRYSRARDDGTAASPLEEQGSDEQMRLLG